MCGRFVITSAPEAMRRLFGYSQQPNFPPRYNIAPTQPVPVVIIENGARHFRLMRWGFIPAWVKDPRGFALLINARAETVLDKPAFKNAIRRRRCLIPADGYYEWSRSETRKRPYFIHARDGQPFGFAGLAETWIGPNGEELDTVAIVTTAASGGLAALHHRVPVTDRARMISSAGWIAGMTKSTPRWRCWRRRATANSSGTRFRSRVNRAANDDAQLILPITAEEAAAEEAKPVKSARKKPEPAASGDGGQGSRCFEL